MKTYHIHRDILGADYQCLIRFLAGRATTCQLILHGEPMGLSCREALSSLAELGGETKEVSKWHGTSLEHGATATLCSLPVTPESLEFLLTHVQSLFSWRWPQEPEDLCFEASDGTPLLISTAHEQYAQYNEEKRHQHLAEDRAARFIRIHAQSSFFPITPVMRSWMRVMTSAPTSSTSPTAEAKPNLSTFSKP